MFIKKVLKKNKKYRKIYESFQLVESIRTPKGPRHVHLLTLGDLKIPKESWGILVDRLQSMLYNQKELFEYDEEIEELANLYKNRIVKQKLVKAKEEEELVTIDINNIGTNENKTIGAEYVCNTFWEELKLTELFEELDFKKNEINVAKTLIFGKLIHPSSELATLYWAKNLSNIEELINARFTRLSKNILYKIGDKIYKNKENIEKHLNDTEKDLFSLSENIILYDLTNTYFEGSGKKNSKAKFGHSKEKRSDCRLITLGLVVDSDGFAKSSKFFAGNQPEAATLEGMIGKMMEMRCNKDNKPTIVFDAGIMTNENRKMLNGKELFYIGVNRGKIPKEIKDLESFDTIIREDADKGIKIEIKKYNIGDEVFLLCKSEKKKLKEDSIIGRVESLLLEELKNLSNSIEKGTIKSEDKINQKIGRIREKYSRISKYYEINTTKENEILKLKYNKIKIEELKENGTYLLRSNRTDLSDKELWLIYNMLLGIEDSFKCLKSELGMRPVYHQKENRTESHIFLSVIAYHIIHCIEKKLEKSGDKRTWKTLRTILNSHCRQTVTLRGKDKEGYHVRVCTLATKDQIDIYKKLDLNPIPIPRKSAVFRL